jgi:hypothetical protein
VALCGNAGKGLSQQKRARSQVEYLRSLHQSSGVSAPALFSTEDRVRVCVPGALPQFEGEVCRHHLRRMCGRIIQASGAMLAIVDGFNLRDHRLDNFPCRYNGAPSQELLVIRENHKTGERTLEPLRWGLLSVRHPM